MQSFKITLFKKPAAQIFILSAIALAVHALVLKFIFPGYYSPLYPYHSDFYIPAALANSSDGFFDYRYFADPRPVGMSFLLLIGHLGTQGAILVTIINVAINCSLTAWLFKKIIGVPFTRLFILFFCVYCYLLFIHPNFYTFYSQDVFSHLSYFLLLTGAILFLHCFPTHKLLSWSFLFIFSVLSFLAKETYALTALFISFAWFVYYQHDSFKKRVYPITAVGTAFAFMVGFNFWIKSGFVSFNNAASDPYHIDTGMASVLKEFTQYGNEGLNFTTGLIMVATILFSGYYFIEKDNKRTYALVCCLFGSFLSWVPNLVIPNHHNSGYSFNGAYLLYLPVLLMLILIKENKYLFLPGIVLLIFSLISPLFNKKEYDRQSWTLIQETSQRNLLHALDTLLGDLQPGSNHQKILLSGLNMPFYPFHHPLSLKNYPTFKYGLYDIVTYTEAPTQPVRDYLVKFVNQADVHTSDYDYIWIFADDGTIVKAFKTSPQTNELFKTEVYRSYVTNLDSIKSKKILSILK